MNCSMNSKSFYYSRCINPGYNERIYDNWKASIIIGDYKWGVWLEISLKDKAAERRMHKISINEPTDEEMMLILEGTIRTFNDYFDREVEPEFIGNILNLSKKFSLNLANPAKAIGLLDVAYASSVVANNGSVVLSDDSWGFYESNMELERKIKLLLQERMFNEILGQEQPLSEITRSLMAVERGLVERPLYTAILAGPSGVGKTGNC